MPVVYIIVFCTLAVLLMMTAFYIGNSRKSKRVFLLIENMAIHNKMHLDATEKQLDRERDQLVLGKETVEGMSRMLESLVFLETETSEMKKDLLFIKKVLSQPEALGEEANLDFQTVQTMNHELTVVEVESEGDSNK